MKRETRIQLIVLLTIVIVGGVWPTAAGYYTDWLWFGEVGYQQVFVTAILTRLGLGAVVAAAAFVLLFGNFRMALQHFDQPYLVLGVSPTDGAPVVLQRRGVSRLILAVSLLGAFVAGLFASNQWMTWLSYRHATPFGDRDPIFGLDVSFFVFQLPWFELVRDLLLAVLLVALGGSVLISLLPGRVAGGSGPMAPLRVARRHLSLLAAAVLLALGAGAYLEAFGLVLSRSDIIVGATYADVTARLPALRVLGMVSIVGAVMASAHAFMKRSWLLPAAFGLYAVAWIGGGVFATGVQRLVVTPNEQVKETPYLAYNIAATRKAFALESVEERQVSGDALLTKKDIAANQAIIGNVRLWDRQPLLNTFGQIQEIRTYYDFGSIDVDRYVINGTYRQVMLSARELNVENLPSRSWIAERLTFTHGYGLTLGPVNEVTQEGLPVLFIKNIPPESSVNLEITEPSIYFGEFSNDYVFVGTRAREFHYPKGDEPVYRNYEGQAGMAVASFFRKMLFATRFKSVKILLSEDLTGASRILIHRNIMDRVTAIAPFLQYDRDPYLVIAGGRLFWLLDAYTTTTHYPYSTRTESGANYIRNSVKVVIDAYNGTTTFYAADPRDPLAATIGRIFPGLLRSIDQMPGELRRHVRYPEGIFAIQCAMYATYHMTDPAVFYNKEDQWEIPAIESTGAVASAMEPYYTIMRLPGQKDAEFIQMLPFTPRRKDNLAAWLVARSDGDRYGHLLVFQFPKQKLVYGPRTIAARINQDQTISPQITLWNQQGSEVVQGTLLVIPIENSLLYIRPLYLRSAGGKIPELKRVIVAYQNQIAMEETLEAAIEKIFRPGVVIKPPEPEAGGAASAEALAAPAADTPLGTLAGLAQQHYERALKAQREGNWAVYGEEIKQVGALLAQMSKPQPAATGGAPAKPVRK